MTGYCRRCGEQICICDEIEATKKQKVESKAKMKKQLMKAKDALEVAVYNGTHSFYTTEKQLDKMNEALQLIDDYIRDEIVKFT